jgi:hypothetical protein
MSLFSNLTTSSDIQAQSDSIGRRVLESDVYTFIIEYAYVQKSEPGALGVHLKLKNPEHELKTSIYVTSGSDKGGLNYYTDKSGNKRYLPGFTVMNDIALLTTGEELSALETEEKVLSLWNFEFKKEVPTKCQVVMPIVGKEITLGILKIEKPKREKDASGNYFDGTETQLINEVVKAFNPADNRTVLEISDDKEEAFFYTEWVAANKGKTVVKKPKGATTASKEEPKPTKKLFGK